MKEFGIIKRFKGIVFRLTYERKHNDLENLFNFSLWFGCPDINKKTGSYEIFVWNHRGLNRPHLALINWNKRMQKQKLEAEQ